MQVDQFVFSTLLMWLQEDGVFTDVPTSGPAAATETSGEDSGAAPAPGSGLRPLQPATTSSRPAPRKALQG